MLRLIDRRLDGKHKGAENRQRFIKRYKAQLKQSVADAMSRRSIKDVGKGQEVNIPAKDIREPVFGHKPGGRRQAVHPGNRDFIAGDKVPRPEGGGSGAGKGASDSGSGEDAFVFELSKEEYLDLFFEDLALPDFVKKQMILPTEFKNVRAGYTTDGAPNNIHVVRSLKGALARRIAMAAPYRERLRSAQLALEDLPPDIEESDPDRCALVEEIDYVEKKIRTIPFIDTFDLRYSNRVRQPEPSSRAVMFCLMDVSASMDRERKDLAKRFFTLLYLFLERNYERTDVVFVRHHTEAKEVDEEDFFYSRETGGTIVSSALRLMDQIVAERYPMSTWNIYGAQASDGENWMKDSTVCRDLLAQKILSYTQYFAYVEVTQSPGQELWREYSTVAEAHANFAIKQIGAPQDIYPVFRELFEKREA